ncbi:MAG: hypothetical protein ACYC3P_06530 [Bellilinea sp.]
MKLSAPKNITWWIAVILGALGLLGYTDVLSFITAANAFWLVLAGFVLLVLATLLKDL